MTRIAILVALTMVACGGPGGPEDAGIDAAMGDAAGDASSDAGVTIEPGDLEDDLCAPIAAHVCDRFAACECGTLLPGGTLDRDACMARWTQRCVTSNASVIAGGAVVDRVAIRACLDRLEAAPACEGLELRSGACDHTVTLPIALGDACTLDTVPCAGGAGVCREGTCRPRAAEGAPCGICLPGLVCREGSCGAAPVPTRTAEGGTCAETSECAQGLRCESSECTAVDACPCGNLEFCGGARTCGARRNAGQECGDDRDCAAELFCTDARTCAERPAEGEPCARNTICAAGLACDGDGGTCRPRPLRGEPCAFDELGPGACADGLGCVEGACDDLPGEDQPCTVDLRCAEGLACAFRDQSVCITPQAAGAPCASDRECAAGLHCGRGDTCEADVATGSPCSVGNECAGVCGPGPSGGLVCLDAPAEGDPCLFDDECPIDLECRPTAAECLPEICTDL